MRVQAQSRGMSNVLNVESVAKQLIRTRMMMPKEMYELKLCTFGGISTLGGNPSVSWINTGGFWSSQPEIYGVLQHELGHALNMQHAQAIDRKSTRLNS